jgi:hypothetical protein
VKCPLCLKLFWIEEASDVAVGFEAAMGKEEVMAPSEKEMLDFMAGSTLLKNKEIYLRMRFWWLGNDAWRSNLRKPRTPAPHRKEAGNPSNLTEVRWF